MAFLLGIDTGGTYTDAVIVDDSVAGSEIVVAAAKAPTTHHDLAQGVENAVSSVLNAAGEVGPGDLSLVSVSTTLATNSLVEGHGDSAALVAIGFGVEDLERAGVVDVVQRDHLIVLAGGHDAHGNEREPFPVEQLQAALAVVPDTAAAVGVTARFSVRNAAHELRAAEMVSAVTSLPVTLSHELSARLDGPRRALTTALNARLLGTIARLNSAVDHVLSTLHIDAPVMVVRGDGSLVSAQFAAMRPIETILSGPAASVVGALHLAGVADGVVADIGGTTTDVAVVSEGRPAIAPRGAVVGGHRTMVEAVDMATTGLGGDSEVRIDTRAHGGPIVLGPERAVPVGRLALEAPGVALELQRQLSAPVGLTTHGRFLVATGIDGVDLEDAREEAVLERLAAGPLAESHAAPSGLDHRAAQRLRARGLVRVCTLTPTDALAVLDGVPGIDREASLLVAEVMARQTSSNGGLIAESGPALCAQVVAALARRSAAFVLSVGLDIDGFGHDVDHPLLQAALEHHRGVVDVGIRLDRPVVAIGAPAAAYYPKVADLLRTDVVVPDHHHVANAVGAVVGRVRVRRSATITQPTKGQFRVHLDEQPTFGSVENARAEARRRLEERALGDAHDAGASSPEVAESWSERTANVDGKIVFVEGILDVEATGRPRF